MLCGYAGIERARIAPMKAVPTPADAYRRLPEKCAGIIALLLFAQAFSCVSGSYIRSHSQPRIQQTDIGLSQLSASRQVPTVDVSADEDVERILPAGPSYVRLMNGRSAPFDSVWTIALRKNSRGIENYQFSYECDTPHVLNGDGDEGDCNISIKEASEEAIQAASLEEFAVHIANVTCVAQRFPGVSICRLIGARRVEAEQPSRISSPDFRTVITGLVLYDLEDLDADGEVRRNTRIVSGTNPTTPYSAAAGGIEDIPVVFFGARMVLPTGQELGGTDALALLNSAIVTTRGQSQIFLHDADSCRPANFSVAGGNPVEGVFELRPPETCGFGATLNRDGSDVNVGFRIRPFKVGTKSAVLNWIDYGRDNVFVPYEQTIHIRIIGETPQPPVVVEVDLEGTDTEFASTPCKGAEEKVQVRMYNMEGATKRAVRILNPNGNVQKVWQEDEGYPIYDPATDTYTSVFTSTGGIGRNVGYQIPITFVKGGERLPIFLPSARAPDVFNFSKPLEISAVLPPVVPFSGGLVTLEGNFQGLRLEDGDSITLGGSALGLPSIFSTNLTHIQLDAPPVESNGDVLAKNIQVFICGAKSNEAELIYGSPPAASIWSLDIGLRESNSTSASVLPSFVVPRTEEGITFVADSEQSNVGLRYLWSLADRSGSRVDLEPFVPAANLSTLLLNTAALPGSREFYTLSIYMENSSGNDTASVVLEVSERGSSVLASVIYPVPPIDRVDDDASVTVHGSARIFGANTLGAENYVGLEWKYRDFLFSRQTLARSIAETHSIHPSSSSATRLGQELNLAVPDLAQGIEKVTLTASIGSDSSFSSSTPLAFQVRQASMVAVVNNGLNMTTVGTSTSLTLSGATSFDQQESSKTFEYKWIRCTRTASSTSDAESTDCLDLLANNNQDLTSKTIEVTSSDLRAAIFEETGEAFLNIGLQVSNPETSAETTARFRVVRSEEERMLPEISDIIFENTKGGRMDKEKVNHLAEVNVQPVVSDKKDSVWSFTLQDSEQNEIPLKDVVREGPGMFSVKSEFDNQPIAFDAGKLAPGKRYRLQAAVRNKVRNTLAETQVMFATLPVPSFACTGPANLESPGIAGKTVYVLSAESSFSSPDLRYCFSIVSRTSGTRYSVGLGCSSVRVARFSWPLIDTYDIVCELQTSGGEVVAREEISGGPGIRIRQDENDSSLGALIEETSSRVDTFRAVGNHEGVLQIAATLPELLTPFLPSLVRQGTTPVNSSDSHSAAASKATKTDSRTNVMDLVANLCAVIREIGTQTVYTSTNIPSTISCAESVMRLPPLFFDEESLLDCMYPVSLSVEASKREDTAPVTGKNVIDSIAKVANWSITTAAQLSQAGTERDRLTSDIERPEEDSQGSKSLFALFLDKVPLFLAQVYLQQGICGSETTLDTTVDSGSVGQPPVRMFMSVLCLTQRKSRLKFELEGDENSDVEVEVCPEVVAKTTTVSGNGRLPLAIKHTDAEQFCKAGPPKELHTLLTAPLEVSFPRLASDEETLVPMDCISVRVPHVDYVLCNLTNASDASKPPTDNTNATAKPSSGLLPVSSKEEDIKEDMANGWRAWMGRYSLGSSIRQKSGELNRVGGRILGGGSFRSVLSADKSANSQFEVASTDVVVLYGERSVVYQTRYSGQFVAGFRRDPGDPVIGFTRDRIIFYVCFMSSGIIVLLLGVVVARGHCVAGVPQRRPAETLFVERDMFARAEHDDIDIAKERIARAKMQNETGPPADAMLFEASAPPLDDFE